jgi:serine/threonine protein kinase
MKTRPASVRPSGGLDRVDSAVQLLEEEWRRYGDVRLETFWADQIRDGAAGSIDSLVLLTALIKADLGLRFDQGQTPTAAGYLRTFPELLSSESRVLSLVYEEYCLREERGSAPEVDSFCDRYPEWKSSLASQLRIHREFSQAAGVSRALPRFPEPGEDFEEFQLLSALGKGGTSRVFLAKDLSLGGKQVALKVTLDRGHEPKVQGALDHPHIVPVNSVVYPSEGNLCGLSMPFRPGLPLDEVIRRVKPAKRPARAMALWDVLDHEPTGTSSMRSTGGREKVDAKRQGGRLGPRGDGWEGFPARGSYAQGAAWIVMIVARALQYAHGKQTYHRDVKPANVLLTLKNGPQLLDFNLADSPYTAERARAALLGGTPPYMAPEQIEAFLNPDRQDAVGAQADIYSLGLVLRELLTGQAPDISPKRLSPSRELLYLLDRRPMLDLAVRRVNPAIPHSLAAIVAKCLAFAPADRYPSAESLAQDLERFLRHQPLLVATNPSRSERVWNVMRRQRRMLTAAAAIVAVAALATGLVASGGLLSRSGKPALPTTDKLSVQTSPLFQSGVACFNEHQYQQAVGFLTNLLKEYPRASLLKLYLGLSLDRLAGADDQKKKDEAQSYLRKAFAALDGEIAVIEWANGRPGLAGELVHFAETTITRVDKEAEEYDVDNPKDDEKRDRLLRQSSYELAADALQLAVKLDPESPTIQRLFAKTEEVRGDFAGAYQRLCELIESAGADSPSDSLFFCRKLRGRVAFLWVESRQKQNSAVNDSLTLLDQAVKDLKWCGHYLETHSFDQDHQLKEYRVLHDRARAVLTRAEVELEHQLLPEAAAHLRSSERMIDELSTGFPELKVPKPTQLTSRKDAVLRRLKTLGFLSEYSSNQASNDARHPS